MAVKTIIGVPVRGRNFYKRQKVEEAFWQKIENGNNILISAPRRVGKTSQMYYFIDNPKRNYLVRYIITESINNENEYYRKLFREIVLMLKGVKKLWKNVLTLVKSKRITSIKIEGITFEDREMNYYGELHSLLEHIDMKGMKLLLLIDEFSETLENIRIDEGERNAIHFLESNRELRTTLGINSKIQFVYAGSIGLENATAGLNSTKRINDLYPFSIPPFTNSEAKGLIERITQESDLHFEESQIKFLLDKIEWLIPYFIQIIIDEIDKIVEKNPQKQITGKIINEAFKKAISHRNYFDNWHGRLRIIFKGSQFNFIKEVLNTTSVKGIITSNEIIDLAVKYSLLDNYSSLMGVLKHDGYLNNEDNPSEYRYNSPLLKLWWNQEITN